MTPTKLNPTECKHVFSYDHERSIIYCPLCGWYWDADFETPTAQPSAVPDRCERSEHVAAITMPTTRAVGCARDAAASEAKPQHGVDTPYACDAMTTPILNADNEPTSEHMMWRRDND